MKRPTIAPSPIVSIYLYYTKRVDVLTDHEQPRTPLVPRESCNGSMAHTLYMSMDP